MKVGRKPGCEIFIDNLAVSGEHANIFTVGEDSFIQDLGSTNGTLVNNKKITKHHLKNGDIVTVGKHTLIYLTESARLQEPENFAKTVIISSGTREAIEPKKEAKPIEKTGETPAITLETKAKVLPESSGVERRRNGAIFVLSGVNSGKRIELTKRVTNLGRTGKRAGCITQTADGYLLTGGEESPPILNGRPVPTQGIKLNNGDVIELAGTRLQFYLK
jgi:pSer/pThr/pTyr-binding forkhead associated (FHA) protein